VEWDYRVVRKKQAWVLPGLESGAYDYSYAIHEAYYEDDKVTALSENPCFVCGETLLEFFSDLQHYISCVEQPILDYETFKEIDSE